MKKLLLLTLIFAVGAVASHGQTIKSLGYNTNGRVVYGGTNPLTFTNSIQISASDGSDPTTLNNSGIGGFDVFFDWEETAVKILDLPVVSFSEFGVGVTVSGPIGFGNFTNSEQWAATTRTNLGLGGTNSVTFNRVVAGATNVPQNGIGNIVAQNGSGEEFHVNSGGFIFYQSTNAGGNLDAETRTFAGGVWYFENGASTRGNIVISNQSATNNGLLFIYRTNNEPFLGLANLIASNNTTISNETLFRVGVAEATNKAAQFGFRSTNTNGDGVAVFSVFGYNALMMIGADASTNAVVYSGGGTNNEVMTLIRDGATEFARPIRFSTNASTRPATNAPANTTNAAAWVEMRIGTNSYRVPLYQ